MKYYIIAGEASGDLHASNLMADIKKNDPMATFRCWGGDLMIAQGAEIVKHIREISFMGFAEVLSNLRTILRNIRLC
ncbi:MAG TPA: lipid-A-disaccharide synthase, partial [Bacteroidales bacterium]|nr:lipid-A-disaccharide synthase [Bacteroidales bacterium]